MNAATFEFTLNARCLASEVAAQANPQALKLAGALHEEELKKARVAAGDAASAKEAVTTLLDAWDAVGYLMDDEGGVKRMAQAVEMAKTLTK